MAHLLKRKIDTFLAEWKHNNAHLPLIVKGARQVGKTASIMAFAEANYESVIAINFALQPKFKNICSDGFDVDSILKNISFLLPDSKLPQKKTLIFFDEIQAYSACATSLKSFALDGNYDVICSGSLMGINYNEIESNSVGYKEDYEMHSMDFEEFLWAKSYSAQQIEGLFNKMIELKPLSTVEVSVLSDIFRDYMITGGMPAIVNNYIKNNNFSDTLGIQKQLLLDYEEDITKYAIGLDKGKIKSIYNHISIFLGKDNKKFQITKIAKNARNRDYIGTVDWLNDAGIINICYCLDSVELPLKGNYNPKSYKLYYKDTGLLIAALDDESQEDLRANRNFNTYKGAIYENIVGDMLVKQGYQLYFYKNESSNLEMYFFVRDRDSLIPIEVKANDNSTRSLNNLLDDNIKFKDIKFGIKLCNRNIGFNGKFYTFPYFLSFMIKRFLQDRNQ